MGVFGRITSMIAGSREEDLIRAKREVVYNVTKKMHPNEANTVERLVREQYEKSLEQILYIVGNSIRHYAKQTNANYIKTSPFMERFVEDYGFQYFTNGFSLGHQTQAGTADEKLQKEISLLMKELHSRMMADALNTFSAQTIAECFSIGAKTAADSGFEAGVQTYTNGYILE